MLIYKQFHSGWKKETKLCQIVEANLRQSKELIYTLIDQI